MFCFESLCHFLVLLLNDLIPEWHKTNSSSSVVSFAELLSLKTLQCQRKAKSFVLLLSLKMLLCTKPLIQLENHYVNEKIHPADTLLYHYVWFSLCCTASIK